MFKMFLFKQYYIYFLWRVGVLADWVWVSRKNEVALGYYSYF